MTWSASVTSVDKTPKGEVRTVVSYTNGAKTFTETYLNVTPESLKQTVVDKVAQLEKADEAAAAITVGAVDTTPVVEEPPEPPVVDSKKIAFLTAYRKVIALKQAIDLGVTSSGDKAYTDALAAAVANYDAAYLANP